MFHDRRVGLRPYFHRHTDDIIALFFQKQGRYRGIYAAGHADDDFSLTGCQRSILLVFFTLTDIVLGLRESFDLDAVLLGIIPERCVNRLLGEQ